MWVTAGEILDGILGQTHMQAVGTETDMDMETAGITVEVADIVPHHITITVGTGADTTLEIVGVEAIIDMAITTTGEVIEVFEQQAIMEIIMFNIVEVTDTIELPIAHDND
jgi:hypothetical protein|tara:strand:+ start:425 stop:757 length:333 start_codon:yes stop_codon:yes gene_type:complete